MIQIKKGDTELKVSEGSYKLYFEKMGYKKVSDKKPKLKETKEVEEVKEEVEEVEKPKNKNVDNKPSKKEEGDK